MTEFSPYSDLVILPSDSEHLAREEEVGNNLGVSGDHMSVRYTLS